jgi:ATP-dependent Clp protease ATP-binding subunit ClpC
MMRPVMREAFTNTLRQVLDSAQREARELNQEFVGTEHLFLGILRCVECDAESILREMQLEPGQLRAAVVRGLPRGSEPPVITGDLPLSPKAQRVINGAIVKAQALRQERISTRFLLLSLLDDPQTLVREALLAQGGDVNVLRQALVEAPDDEEA